MRAGLWHVQDDRLQAESEMGIHWEEISLDTTKELPQDSIEPTFQECIRRLFTTLANLIEA